MRIAVEDCPGHAWRPTADRRSGSYFSGRTLPVAARPPVCRQTGIPGPADTRLPTRGLAATFPRTTACRPEVWRLSSLKPDQVEKVVTGRTGLRLTGGRRLHLKHAIWGDRADAATAGGFPAWQFVRSVAALSARLENPSTSPGVPVTDYELHEVRVRNRLSFTGGNP